MLKESYIARVNQGLVPPRSHKVLVVRFPRYTSLKLYDEYIRDLSPSERLVYAVKKQGLPWSEFSKRFLEEMNHDRKMARLERLAELSKSRDIYLICFEVPPQPCHRYLLLKLARDKFNVPVQSSVDLETV